MMGKQALSWTRLVTLVARECSEWLEFFFGIIPGALGRRSRGYYFSLRFKKAGKNLSIGNRSTFRCPFNVHVGEHFQVGEDVFLSAEDNGAINIGDRFSANRNVMINADKGGVITIGDDVLIGPGVVIRAGQHVHSNLDIPIRAQGHAPGEIVIGDDVWIGANVVILSPVSIGSHSIIAAGSVVVRDVPQFSVHGGIPSRKISDRRGD